MSRRATCASSRRPAKALSSSACSRLKRAAGPRPRTPRRRSHARRKAWAARKGAANGIGVMTVLVNIDVPNLEAAVAFYTRAFGLSVARRFGDDGAELVGWPVAVFLLQKGPGSLAAPGSY